MNPKARHQMVWIALGLIISAGLLVLFWCDPVRVAIYPQCIFYQLTGLDCPGCGGLRAMHALLHGNVAAALRFNAFVVLSLPLLMWFGGAQLVCKIRRQPLRAVRPWGLGLYLAAFVLFGIVRDLPVPVLAWFAP